MKYLLDTNIIVDHLRKRKFLHASWFDEGCGISIITQAELFYGAEKSGFPDRELKNMQDTFDEWGIEVVTLSSNAARLYGKHKAFLEGAGKRLDEFDLLIAATAISGDLTLVTGNKKHFERVSGLRVE
ncbi:MAG: type II toxin-antitoxin system VapC family toxin [Patescibacteria group bacterium]